MHTACGGFFNLVFKSEAQCEEGYTTLLSQPPYEDVGYVSPWKPSWGGGSSELYPNASVPSWLSTFFGRWVSQLGGYTQAVSKGTSLLPLLVPLHSIQFNLYNESCSVKSFVLFMTGTEWCRLLLALLSETAGSLFLRRNKSA